YEARSDRLAGMTGSNPARTATSSWMARFIQRCERNDTAIKIQPDSCPEGLRGGGFVSQRAHLADCERVIPRTQRVRERRAELSELDLEHIARLHAHAIGKAQSSGPEEMQVNIERSTMLRILEVVVLEIGKRVTHVRLAGEERLFPDHLRSSSDPTAPFQVGR